MNDAAAIVTTAPPARLCTDRAIRGQGVILDAVIRAENMLPDMISHVLHLLELVAQLAGNARAWVELLEPILSRYVL